MAGILGTGSPWFKLPPLQVQNDDNSNDSNTPDDAVTQPQYNANPVIRDDGSFVPHEPLPEDQQTPAPIQIGQADPNNINPSPDFPPAPSGEQTQQLPPQMNRKPGEQAIYDLQQRYGIQASGPGSGNGDTAYWLRRIGETTPGWDPSQPVPQYWIDRMTQEFSGHPQQENPTNFGALPDFSSVIGNMPQVNLPNINFSQGALSLPDDIMNNDFTKMITQGYGDIINSGGASKDPFTLDLKSKLQGITGGAGGQAGFGSPAFAPALESARSSLDMARNAETNQLDANLANRGITSMPGAESGANRAGANSIETQLAPTYTKAISDWLTSTYGTALNDSTSIANNENGNVLSALNGATGYQKMVSDVALNLLQQNTSFNEFLANFGLSRAEAMYKIQNDQATTLLNAYAQFLAFGNTVSGGFV